VLEIASKDGTIKERGVIDHPGSVVILPMDGNMVKVLRQYRIAFDSTILELPAGTREPNEDWLSCARREIREETGYRAEEWIDLGRVWPAPGITNEVMAVYLASELRQAPLPPDADEEIEVVNIPLSRLVDMAINGELHDAKSVVAVLRTAAHLGILPGSQQPSPSLD
jgi:ADP-ribose pyrophosphatase